MLPLLKNAPSDVGWRDYVHGEHSACYHDDMAMQFLTDGKEKYIWYTKTGEEQLFNLEDDPEELYDLVDHGASQERVLLWRPRMVAELKDRNEDGLCDDSQLIVGKLLPPFRSL